MFSLDQAMAEWRRQMLAAGIKTPVLLDELESHLRDDVEQQIQAGLSEQQAFERAIQRIGEAHALKCEFEKVGGTKWTLLRILKGIFGRYVGVPVSPLSNFNASARQTLEFARAEAPRFHHDFIGTEHVLLGLLTLENGVVPNILRRFGVEREAIRLEIEQFVGVGPAHEAATAIPYTPRVKKALELAIREAKAMNQVDVSTEHIFLGLLLEGDGVAAHVLKKLGVQIERTREAILTELDQRGGE